MSTGVELSASICAMLKNCRACIITSPLHHGSLIFKTELYIGLNALSRMHRSVILQEHRLRWKGFLNIKNCVIFSCIFKSN
ncbi:Uncharacterized protein APZ42_017680 [Daphnia magna]|uniref:Uncharacterized protein n=1 Tax=Daphnia magna TaxID=35525 RepID=A0A164ZZK1_9CRUS|nr:Uncharacterized protein APZ42_017680 [Daphnia magna]